MSRFFLFAAGPDCQLDSHFGGIYYNVHKNG